MQRISRHTKQFRHDYKKCKRSARDRIGKLDALMWQLIRKETLDPKHRDHALHGEWQRCRDCHVEGDWILVYELSLDEQGREAIIFHATGNHEYLFG